MTIVIRLRRILLATFGLVIALLLCECVARIMIPGVNATPFMRFRDGYYVFTGNVGARSEFRVTGRVNLQWFNDTWHSRKKPLGTTRIVVLGDSFVEAFQVRQDQNFGKLLERETGYEVIMLGNSGNGSARNLENLVNIGLAYDPDIVIHVFCVANDVMNDSEKLTQQRKRQYKTLLAISQLGYLPDTYDSPLRLFQMAATPLMVKNYQKRIGANVPVDFHVFRADYDSAWIEGWKQTLNLTLQIKDTAQRTGAKYLLVSTTDNARLKNPRDLISLYPGAALMRWNFFRPERILEQFAKENRIAYVPLQYIFKKLHDETGKYPGYRYDGHWNPTGHRWVANALKSQLKKL